MFLTPGDPIFHIGFLKITREGIRISIFMALRLVYLVVGSSVMTLTTTPNALTDGLEKSLGFLKIIKIPVHEIAMMMSIALRFIPISWKRQTRSRRHRWPEVLILKQEIL